MMPRLKVIASTLAIGMIAALSDPAIAKTGTLVVLGDSEASSVATLGAIAPSKPKAMDLGPLRLGEAQLPGGITSKADRMRLRAERAEARKRALDEAKR